MMNTLCNTHESLNIKRLSYRTPVRHNSPHKTVTRLLLILFAFTLSSFSWGESQAGTDFGIGYTDEQLTLDREWVLSQPPSNYTVQFVAALKPDTVTKIIKNYSLEGPIHIINTHYNDKNWTVMIRGSYSNHADAIKVIKQLPERLKQAKPFIWARSFRSLHEIIVRPAVAAPPPDPAIYDFAATSNTITAGESAALLADFSNGEGFIDNSLGSIITNEPIYVTPSATTTYTLTVSNEAGVTTSRSVTVTVVEPKPTISHFSADTATITTGDSTSLTTAFSNGTGSIDNAIGSVTSGENITVSPTVTTTYTLTVTNAAGVTTSRSVTVTVVEPEPVEMVTLEEVDPSIYGGAHRSLRGVDAINWIMEREPKHYTVRLYSTDSLREMEQFTVNKELPENSAFYRVKENSVMQYVLIYGDFSKRSQARKSIREVEKALRGGNLKIRRFKSLQKELDNAQY